MDCTVIVLVGGGAASRMAPLSRGRSKAVIPFLGRPLLHYLLRLLARDGLTDVVLTSSGVDDDARRCFGDGSSYGLDVRYGIASGPAGTVSDVRGAFGVPGRRAGKTVLIIYGDSLLEADLGTFVAGHVASGAAVTLLTHTARFDAFPLVTAGSTEPPTRTNFGIVQARCGGPVERFVEKPTFDAIASFVEPRASAAVYAIDRDFLEGALADETSPRDFGMDCFPAWIAGGVDVRAADIGRGFRFDIGTLPLYLTMQLAALRGLVPITPDFPRARDVGWVEASANMSVSAAEITQSIVCAGARIAEDAKVACSVIGKGTVIEAGAIIEESVILENARIGARSVVRRSIVGPEVTINADVQLPAESVLGDSCRIGGRLVLDDAVIQQLLRI